MQSKVYLTPWVREIEDQGNIGSCVAASTVSLLELISYRANKDYNLSKLGLYHDTLVYSNTPLSGDNGLVSGDALTVGATIGVGDESLHVYNTNNVAGTPSASYYADALTQKITHWREVKLDPDSFINSTNKIKAELVKGNPVLAAVNLQNWQFNLAGNYDNHDVISGTLAPAGKHQWLIVGYDNTLNGGSFLIENSWADWGQSGVGAISYTMVNQTFRAHVVEGFAGMDFRHTDQRQAATELYVAMFNRAPELSGLDYWAGQMETFSFAEVAQSMYNCEPSRVLYPNGISNQNTISSFYKNVLGRDADTSGLAYWTSKLDAGGTKGLVVSEIITAVSDYNGNDVSGINSHNLFSNKVEVGMHYAVSMQAEDLNVAKVALIGITSDVNTIEGIKLNLSHQLGWL